MKSKRYIEKVKRKRTAKKVSGFIEVGRDLASVNTPYKFVRVELQRASETMLAATTPVGVPSNFCKS